MASLQELFHTDAESALMGAALLDNSLFLVAEPRDFGTPGFERLWIACQELVRQGMKPDIVTIPQDAMPGGWTFQKLFDSCPTVMGADGWLKIIRRLACRREEKAAAQRLMEAAHSQDDDQRRGLLELYHAHLDASLEPSGKRLWSAAELLENRKPLPPDLVEGFIPGQTAVLLSGPGGDGKSYAVLDLAVAVASGDYWLGLEALQVPVLIIDVENRRNRVEERLAETLQGHDLTGHAPPVHFAFEVTHHLDQDEAIMEYAQMAQEVDAGLIILDSLVDFLGETDENSNPEMGRIAQRLRALVDYAKVSVMAVHHTPKSGDGPRGATALRNGIDVNIMVSRDGDVLTLSQDKNRVGPEQTIVCRLNWAPGLFNLSPIGVTIGRKRTAPDPDEAAILEFLEDGQWYTSSDVVNSVMEQSGHTRRTVQRKLSGMIADGLVESSEKEPGRRYQVRIHQDKPTLL